MMVAWLLILSSAYPNHLPAATKSWLSAKLHQARIYFIVMSFFRRPCSGERAYNAIEPAAISRKRYYY